MIAGAGKFVRFCIAGALGFIIDAGLCIILTKLLFVSPLIARFISIAVAMAATWYVNRRLTFGKSNVSAAIELFKYVTATSFGAVVNYLVYAVSITLFPVLGITFAIALGSLAGLFLNYNLANRLVFFRADQ
jgi:putative flippase GtrA